MTRRISHWINGREVTGAGPVLPVYDPSTGHIIAEMPEADSDQVLEATAAAARVFASGKWALASYAERKKVLRKAATLIRENTDALVEAQVNETGLLPTGVRGQVTAAAGWLDYYADFLTQNHGESYRQLEFATTLVEREPIGVCALFSPWNVPLTLSAIKLAPALAAGNCVVLKPSEETPMAIRLLVDLIQQSGLPDGVLHCVNGRGASTGKALAGAEDIDMISFTGGSTGGRAVAEAAARRHLPCVMELGGKSATIVFADADQDAALDGALTGAYANNGQACLAGSRILLDSAIADQFIEKFRQRVQSMKVGNPWDHGISLGPMISAAHRDRVLAFYQSAAEDGDQVLFGGRPPSRGGGFFLDYGAVLAQSTRSRIWTEEVFGPIATFMIFYDQNQAIALANDSHYGLAGYIWTRDIKRAMQVARRVRAGTMLINTSFMRESNAPFGGYKASGVGREGGWQSWHNFTEAKTTIISHDGD